ncbi:fimbrial protein [Pseudomonas simiae]|jgi:type 1 fimbria pilin|uniref:fimbrial protein n=1 Tax=Pseudomonas simiae TaxID=321846 RepID=UPI0009DD6EF8|nr:fimbrial protein [Pseudomonas simiae]
MTYWQLRKLLALCITCISSGASAVDNISFSGTLNDPPACTIDGGNAIEVDFGDLAISMIDGVNYLKTVPYTITCAANPLPWALKLSINGTQAGFDSSAVQSSVPELGIRLLQNGVGFDLNTPLDITLGAPPVLQAVPVKEAGVTLNPGGFTAVATLLAEYE